MIASVAVSVRNRRTDRLYDYTVAPDAPVAVGQCVEVPFGRRMVAGYVMRLQGSDRAFSGDDAKGGVPGDGSADAPNPELKAVRRAVPDAPRLTPELVEMVRFLRTRYLASWGAAVAAVLPTVVRAQERVAYGKGADAASLPGELAAYLERRGEIAPTTLRARFGIGEGRLRRLVASDALVALRSVRTARSEPMETFVARAPEAAGGDGPRGPRARAVWAHLAQQGGPVPLARVTAETGAGTAVVQGMARQGYVVLTRRSAPVDGQAPTTGGAEAEPLALTDEQAAAVSSIRSASSQRRHRVLVLRGVTGSGKTEVYLRAIEHVLAQGQSALMLVPEIALTAQMTQRVRLRFGSHVAVLHSGLTGRERYLQWRRIAQGGARVVVGARSAVFAPLDNIGLIVIDEEQEATYKQDGGEPRYVTREVAVWRAQRANAPLVLGSATPSLETMYRAQVGRYDLLTLTGRPGGQQLPAVRLVDMRQEWREGGRSLFSRALQTAVEDRLARREQVILFLNRRGYANIVLCRDCGDVATCPSCDISLTVHRAAGEVLLCHLCGFTEPFPERCRGCGSRRIQRFGFGTQRVEQEIFDRFAGARVIRMDVDTTGSRGAHERMLTEFEAGGADILLGTQMIAKGLDFSRVSLVGVIVADTALRIPDVRAAERTFQLLVQVSGRAGRREVRGETIIQTFAAEHYAVQCAVRQDYDEFYHVELAARRALEYPPFTEITQFVVGHRDDRLARLACGRLHKHLTEQLGSQPRVRILPVVPASIARVRDVFRYRVVLKYPSFRAIEEGLRAAYERAMDELPSGTALSVDVNAHALV